VYERLGKERHYTGGGDAGADSSDAHGSPMGMGRGMGRGLVVRGGEQQRRRRSDEEAREYQRGHDGHDGHDKCGSYSSDEGQREDGRSVAGRSTAYSRADTSFYTDDNPNSDVGEQEEEEEHDGALRVVDGVLHRAEEHYHAAGAMNPDYTPRSRASRRSSGASSARSARTESGEPEAEERAAAAAAGGGDHGTPGRHHAYALRPRGSASVSSVRTDGAVGEADAETETAGDGEASSSPSRLQMTRCGDETSVEGSVRGSSTVRGGSLYGGSLYGESLYEGSGSEQHDDDVDGGHTSSDGGSHHGAGDHSALHLAQEQAEQGLVRRANANTRLDPHSRAGNALSVHASGLAYKYRQGLVVLL